MAESRCGSEALLAMPEDVLAMISSLLRARDLCALAQTCRALHRAITLSEKCWLAQCLILPTSPPPHLLPVWRVSFPSYLLLFRFVLSLSPLLGLWAHQNPELGNAVLALWGHLPSLLAFRIIPQELPSLGLESGPLLFAPVFEILPNPQDCLSPPLFFLHGAGDSVHPGSVSMVHPDSNVLLLEVDAQSQSPSPPGFVRLSFGDRRRVLDFVAKRVRIAVPPNLASAPMLRHRDEDDSLLQMRMSWLLDTHKAHNGRIDRCVAESNLSGVGRKASDDSEVAGNWRRRQPGFLHGWVFWVDELLGKSRSLNGTKTSSMNINGESKHISLQDFLRSGDTIGLSLRGAQMKLSTYRAWPNMHGNKFALYKLPMQKPETGREYAGLWGGTFGWPPGRASEDKPGKALFFLLLSYEESDGQLLLIATKILEGTHYVLHPNGSAMFIVKVGEPAVDPFPWVKDGDSHQVEVKHAYKGEGIANGYGFRYPGSKPGSLFVTHNGLIAFVWRDTKVVLTLERLNLEELLKKGERVPALPPIANFAYLTKSYSNVFAGFPSNPTYSS
ncbi:LOW QUALITY PROTEIN: F-box protein At5g39450-like [Dioscorea cayenensis subsp. rotundata]|uniref:LOW QUALITY PROTEIN: F-box protein At5g39450-like n=1 Tax=Dioscorea cayennensis subsp. rotundata TaxID=55577 RepID=A0AB40B1Z8_DIOCR|nr:LOW QUALITY PROTEIN: F-box protein At5g39450-like [Dioscorea cayenensis subsp. rotundata]